MRPATQDRTLPKKKRLPVSSRTAPIERTVRQQTAALFSVGPSGTTHTEQQSTETVYAANTPDNCNQQQPAAVQPGEAQNQETAAQAYRKTYQAKGRLVNLFG